MRPDLTRSEPRSELIAGRLREERARLLADAPRRGRAFGRAMAEVIDIALREVFDALETRVDIAVVALGSYARDELCPGSDVDVLLVHALKGRRSVDVVRAITEELWYPLWDAGFVTGHGARSVKESIALADSDIDALTALLNVRLVAGDATLAGELQTKARELAAKRRDRVLRTLADASEVRRVRPGLIAEMLEPDLKEGGGGLRDVQSLAWAGWALGEPGGRDALVAADYLTEADLDRIASGYELLLDTRVALQQVTTARSDRLALQEQDAVAAALGVADADALVRGLASSARELAWITADVWSRVRERLGGAGARTHEPEVLLAEGVALRNGRVHIAAEPDGSVPPLRALEAAAAAAEFDAPFDRTSLTGLRKMRDPTWDVWERAAFLRLCAAGTNAVPVFEALDHEGVLVLLLPEWEHVRSLPQRNAYHRFTVDRHLLEAVAECARLLDAGDHREIPRHDVEAVVARAMRRPELLLLGALLHDIAKGRPGDHSEVGAETAATVARRIGLDSEGREIVVWLVRKHLLMAEVATRRDLADASVADGVAAACAGDAERLRLLYLLTIGDSRATGPAAWSPSKASLVRDLFVKVAAAIERGEARVLAADRRQTLAERLGDERAAAFLARLPDDYVLAFSPDEMEMHEALLGSESAVQCERVDGDVVLSVVAVDRPGLLATLAGVLTMAGLDVLSAALFGTIDGLALDVFRAADPFGRVDDEGARVMRAITAALEGDTDLARRVDERRRAYARGDTVPGPIRIDFDTEISDTDTVVEVHADDDVGLLYRLASAFSELELDVRVAKVATLGTRVVDVFYVRGSDGGKLDDGRTIEHVRGVLAQFIAGTSSG